MPQPSTFEQMTTDYHKWTLCPHLADSGSPDNLTHLINLIDTPVLVVTLALCNQCSHVVGSTLMDERLDAAFDRWELRKEERETRRAIEVSQMGTYLLSDWPRAGEFAQRVETVKPRTPDLPAPTTSAPWIVSEVKPPPDDKP